MKKHLLFAATMAAMLASCSSEDALQQSSNNLSKETEIENAVTFSAYTQRGLTRSGDAGVLDNTQLATKGFGVFGYYTDMNMYEPTASPNFMYNEHVTKVGGSWTYSPIKYWPNEYGSKAQSDDVDKVTFFAYAPYVANTPETGKVADDKVGITGFTRNTALGDPIVRYIGSLDPTKCVDLCWGVCAEADATWNIIQGGSQTLTAGLPWLNVQRPQKSLGQKVKFTFKHALAQLNVQIDADVNTNVHGDGAEVDANTKVFVRKVTFNGFAMKGALNLNNEVADQPNWIGYSCSDPIQSEEYTIYDGMKDGKEGTGYIAGNEKVTGLNPTLIQTKKWSEQAATDGVQKTAKNLFNAADVDAPIYVIPTGEELSITIEYDIETADPKLAGTVSDWETHGVSEDNKITKTITLSGDATQKMILEAGKKHTIKLHLGMSQVDFDAAVSDWEDAAAEGEAWVPENGEIVVPATGISFDQTALNMNVGDPDVTLAATVTPANATDKSVTWTTSNPAVATVDANGKVHAVGPGTATITGTNSAGQTATCSVTVVSDPGIPLSEATTGMFVGQNGKAYASKDEATAAGTEAKAWIAYKSATAGASLAIALTDDISSTTWSDNIGATTPKWAGDLNRPAISGGTWRWPSKADFVKMLPGLKTLDLNNDIIASGEYWSSTEDESNSHIAWTLRFNGPSSGVYASYNKTAPSVDVRACFAF